MFNLAGGRILMRGRQLRTLLAAKFGGGFSRFRHGALAAGEKGLTLLEIIIVIALIGSLLAILAKNLISTSDNAKVDEARIAMATLSQALQMYRVHNNKYPTTDQTLNALVTAPGDAKNWRGPYTEGNQLKDPWGTEYGYESDGRTLKIISAGLDQQLGTSDDIFYPDQGKATEPK